MSNNLSSAAVMIGALRVKESFYVYVGLTLAQNLLQPTLCSNGKSWSQINLTLAKNVYQEVIFYLNMAHF